MQTASFTTAIPYTKLQAMVKSSAFLYTRFSSEKIHLGCKEFQTLHHLLLWSGLWAMGRHATCKRHKWIKIIDR